MFLRADGAGLNLSSVIEDELLIGPTNGVNKTYILPFGHTAVRVDPGVKVKVYYNGHRLREGLANDYTVAESGGPGTGYDTVTMIFVAPKFGDSVTADYFLTP